MPAPPIHPGAIAVAAMSAPVTPISPVGVDARGGPVVHSFGAGGVSWRGAPPPGLRLVTTPLFSFWTR